MILDAFGLMPEDCLIHQPPRNMQHTMKDWMTSVSGAGITSVAADTAVSAVDPHLAFWSGVLAIVVGVLTAIYTAGRIVDIVLTIRQKLAERDIQRKLLRRITGEATKPDELA